MKKNLNIEKILHSWGITLSSEMVALLQLAFPIIGTTLLQMAYNLTDMIWVGRLGSNAVAAVGSAGFYLHLGWALISVLVIGANIKISHSVGAKKRYSWGRLATTAVWAAMSLALIYVMFLFFFSTDLIGFFRFQDVEIEQMARSYLLISAGGILFSFLSMLFATVLNAHSLTTISFKAMVLGTLINVILDPLLIFGAKLGIQGAAIATITSQLAVVIYFARYFLTSPKSFFAGAWPSFHSMKKIILVGAPISAQRIIFILVSIVMARIIAHWGPQAIAVQKIGVQIEAITYMSTGGLMEAMRIIVGQSYGARDMERVNRGYQAGLKLAIGIGLVSSLLFFTIPEYLFAIFLQEPESIEMGKHYLVILGLSQVFMCIEMVTSGAYHGMGLTRVSATVSIIFTSLRIPLAYMLGMWTFLELNGVWVSITISSILKGLILFFLFYRIRQKLKMEQCIVHNC